MHAFHEQGGEAGAFMRVVYFPFHFAAGQVAVLNIWQGIEAIPVFLKDIVFRKDYFVDLVSGNKILEGRITGAVEYFGSHGADR